MRTFSRSLLSAIAVVVVTLTLSAATPEAGHKFHQNGATILYQLPKGWIVQKITEPSDHYNILSPVGRIKPSDPSITIDYYKQFDSKFPHTQAGCAASYLAGIHSQTDEKVRMSVTGSIASPRQDAISQYRLVSDYYGDHLVSFIVTKQGFVTVELWLDTAVAKEQKRLEPPFQEVARSISITRSPK